MGTPCQFTDSSSAYSYPYSATFALDIPEFIRRDINSIKSSCPSVLIAGSVVTTGGCSSIFIICYTSPNTSIASLYTLNSCRYYGRELAKLSPSLFAIYSRSQWQHRHLHGVSLYPHALLRLHR